MNKDIFGKTAKFQKAKLLVAFEGQLYKVGWFSFARDGGFYAQFNYKEPITAIGQAVQSSGAIKKITEEDVSHIPLDDRCDVHLSLHPSGQFHVRSGERRPVVEIDVGHWLPLTTPRPLGHLFSPAVRSLPKQKDCGGQDRVTAVSCLDCGVRATITLLPLLPVGYVLREPALMGVSPRFNICVSISEVNPPTPYMCFVNNLNPPNVLEG
jgi:hypothetical protein